MKYQKQGSIVVVSDEKEQSLPNCPNPQPFEIRDPEDRAKAIEGLTLLWQAMQLGKGSHVDNGGGDGRAVGEARYRIYRLLGKMILGGDCPEFEIWT